MIADVCGDQLEISYSVFGFERRDHSIKMHAHACKPTRGASIAVAEPRVVGKPELRQRWSTPFSLDT